MASSSSSRTVQLDNQYTNSLVDSLDSAIKTINAALNSGVTRARDKVKLTNLTDDEIATRVATYINSRPSTEDHTALINALQLYFHYQESQPLQQQQQQQQPEDVPLVTATTQNPYWDNGDGDATEELFFLDALTDPTTGDLLQTDWLLEAAGIRQSETTSELLLGLYDLYHNARDRYNQVIMNMYLLTHSRDQFLNEFLQFSEEDMVDGTDVSDLFRLRMFEAYAAQNQTPLTLITFPTLESKLMRVFRQWILQAYREYFLPVDFEQRLQQVSPPTITLESLFANPQEWEMAIGNPVADAAADTEEAATANTTDIRWEYLWRVLEMHQELGDEYPIYKSFFAYLYNRLTQPAAAAAAAAPSSTAAEATTATDPLQGGEVVSSLSLMQQITRNENRKFWSSKNDVYTTRFIHINSDFRDRTFFPSSSEFTIALSETLKNVTEIAIQNATIPLKWNYISTDFGANFLFLQGNADGIRDNESFEYKISVPSGITSSTIFTDLAAGVVTMKAEHPDVDFDVSFANANDFTVAQVKIRKWFNEQDFSMTFNSGLDASTLTDPDFDRFSSSHLMNYLGFEQGMETFFNHVLYGTPETAQSFTDTNRINSLNTVNDVLTIVQYASSASYADFPTAAARTAATLFTKVVPVPPGGFVNRAAMVAAWNVHFVENRDVFTIDDTLAATVTSSAAMLAEPFAVQDYMDEIDYQHTALFEQAFQRGPSITKYRAGLSIHLNRANTSRVAGARTAIVFRPGSIWDTVFRFTDMATLVEDETAPFYSMELGQHMATLPTFQSEITVPTGSEGGDYNAFRLRCVSPSFFSNGLSTSDWWTQEHMGTTNADTVVFRNQNDVLVRLTPNLEAATQYYPYFPLGVLQQIFDDTIATSVPEMSGTVLTLNNEGKAMLDVNYIFDFGLDDFSISFPSTSVLATSFYFAASDVTRYNTGSGNTEDATGTSITISSASLDTVALDAIYKIDPGAILFTLHPRSDRLVNMAPIQVISVNGVPNKTATTIGDYIQLDITTFSSPDYAPSLQIRQVSFQVVDRKFQLTIRQISMQLTELNYEVEFCHNVASSSSSSSSPSIWSQLHFEQSPSFYVLNDLAVPNATSVQVVATTKLQGFDFLPSTERDETITFHPLTNGLFAEVYTPTLVLIAKANPEDSATTRKIRKNVLDDINQSLTNAMSLGLVQPGSRVFTRTNLVTNAEYIVWDVRMQHEFFTKDFKMVFFDKELFTNVNCGGKSASGTGKGYNTTVDGTLGWTLGFQKYVNIEMNPDAQDVYTGYTANVTTFYDATTHVCTFRGDVSRLVQTTMYQYLYLVLNDYTQSVFSDGLVSTGTEELVSVTCRAKTRAALDTNNQDTVTSSSTTLNKLVNLYARQQELESTANINSENYRSRSFTKDVFALIQVKESNTNDGGWMKNQTRVYTGPVNLSKFSIRLLTDRGVPLQLNADWSFTLECKLLQTSAALPPPAPTASTAAAAATPTPTAP